MTILELYHFLDARYPRSLSCEWDNDGLMCCPDPNKPVTKVLLTLDVTEKAITAAEQHGAELMISHHPLVFKPIRGLHPFTPEGAKLLRLAEKGISVFSFHTRLDAAADGVGQCLAKTLGLTEITSFSVENQPMGRVGKLPAPLSPEETAAFLKKALHAPEITFVGGGKEIGTLAVLGGSGSDGVDAAIEAGADGYVTGDMGYNAMLTAAEKGLTVFRCGHFETENPVLEALERALRAADPSIEIHRFFSRTVETV